MAYEQSSKAGTATSTDSDATTASVSAPQDGQTRMMQQLIQLIRAYGDHSKAAQSSSVSASA
jgi:hypothetical protein